MQTSTIENRWKIIKLAKPLKNDKSNQKTNQYNAKKVIKSNYKLK